MEHFAQMNVFAWIRIIFAHLIIGCVIRYPKTGNLHYTVSKIYVLVSYFNCWNLYHHSFNNAIYKICYTVVAKSPTQKEDIISVIYQLTDTTESSTLKDKSCVHHSITEYICKTKGLKYFMLFVFVKSIKQQFNCE